MVTFVERQWLANDGLQLFARDYSPAKAGSGKLPVVCLHGLTRNSRDFEDFAPFVAALGRRAIVADMRGRGRSAWDPDPANYNLATYASDTLALLDALAINRAVFLGTSMGGAISMMIAVSAGGRISAAILNDVGGEVCAEGLTRIMRYAGKPAPVTDWTTAAAYVRDIIGDALPGRDADCWDRIARRLFTEDRSGRPLLDYDPAIMVPPESSATAPASLWPQLEALTTGRPVLTLRGALSDILTKDVAERMRDGADDLTLVTIPGAGHAPLLDEPHAVEAIERFLMRVE